MSVCESGDFIIKQLNASIQGSDSDIKYLNTTSQCMQWHWFKYLNF